MKIFNTNNTSHKILTFCLLISCFIVNIFAQSSALSDLINKTQAQSEIIKDTLSKDNNTNNDIDESVTLPDYSHNKDDYSVPVVLTTNNMASISSEISGNVTQIFVREGDYFKKDDVILKFDCTLLDASLKKAESELKFAKNKNDTITRLNKLDGISNMELITSQSELAKAEAEFEIAKYNASQCILKAPFTGQLVALYIKDHETVKAGSKLYDIVDNKNFEIAIIVPSDWLIWLQKGDAFSLDIRETKKTYKGVVSSIIYSVDAVSQSVKLIGKVIDDTEGLFIGASGTAKFEGPKNGRAE